MSPLARVELQSISRVIAGGKSGQTGSDFVPTGYPAYGAGGVNGYLDGFEYDGEAVILSSIGARCGKAFYPVGKWSSLANTQLIFPDPNRVDRRFLWRQINDEGRWHRSGTAQPYIKPLDIKTSRVFLPPLPEQRRIAAILDQADELRTKRQRALELLDELADSNFASLEAEIESSSGQVCIRDVADIQTGPFGSLLHKEDYVLGSVPIVNPTHIVDGEIVPDPKLTVSIQKCEELAVFALRAGDVVLGRRGEMGRAAVVREGSLPLLCGTGSMILRPRDGRINGEVLATTIRSPKVRKSLEDAALGATMLNLNQRIVGDLYIALPGLDTQNAFANSSHRLRLQREVILGQITVLDELFASIKHNAFRGEL